MKISIFGLGYVGVVQSACLAVEGHEIIGVDTNTLKVDLINKGRSPIVEEKIDKLVKKAIENSRLKAITEHRQAVLLTDISIICVGTPSDKNGSLDCSLVKKCLIEISKALKVKKRKHTLVLRSTLLPDIIRKEIIPLVERLSHKKLNKDFYFCVNPEFMREGSSVDDYYHPPFIIVGEDGGKIGSRILRKIYKNVKAKFIETDIGLSAMIKYASNAFHALKIAFANEIKQICEAIGVDSHALMKIFMKDKKLNISGAYLNPGFAFGGPCLPKDLRAINYKAKIFGLELPVLNSILESNDKHLKNVINYILSLGNEKIGILGLSFKQKTDDLRESPIVTLAEALLGKGREIMIYDNKVNLSSLVGVNKKYIQEHILHIGKLLKKDKEIVLEGAKIIIGSYGLAVSEKVRLMKENKIVIELTDHIKDRDV